MYVQLGNFPSHYLVLVITDEDFRYALISVKVLPNTMYTEMVMEDIAWLDVQRVHGSQLAIKPLPGADEVTDLGQKHKRPDAHDIVGGIIEQQTQSRLRYERLQRP